MSIIAAPRCRFQALLLLLLIGWPSTARAQWPQWAAIEGAAGEAVGWGGEYRDRVLGTWRLSAQARIAHIGPASVLASIERDRVVTNGDGIDICVPGSSGQCLPEYPVVAGWMLGAGIRTPTNRRVALTAFTGLGRHRTIDRRGDRPDDATAAWMIHGDVALRLWRALWLTAGARRTQLLSVRDQTLHVRAITLGLRVD